MKTKNLLAITAIIILFVSWNPTIGATENIIDLGTIHYDNAQEKTLRVEINSSSIINLRYVSSDVNTSALTIYDHWFSILDNKTTYIFTSKHMTVDWYFIKGVKSFIYQDNTTDQLYRVNIDFSDITIPPNPVVEWVLKYNISTTSLKALQELYNSTFFNLTETNQKLNLTMNEKEELTSLLMTISSETTGLQQQLNDTKTTLEGAITNATIFRRFYEEMTSYGEGFSFKIAGDSEEYITIYKYETDIDDLRNQIGGFPLILFFSVIISIVICLMAGYWKWAKRRKSPEELHMLEGVDPQTTMINRFKSKLKIKPANVNIKEKEIPMILPETIPKKIPETRPSAKEEYDNIQKNIDLKLKSIESKIESEIESKMDSINSNYGIILDRLDRITVPKEKQKTINK